MHVKSVRSCSVRVGIMLGAAAAVLASAPVQAGPVYATYQGSQLGVTDRTAALVQTNAFSTGVVQSGIAVTTDNRIYTTAQNTIREYDVAGNLVNLMTFPSAGIDYTGIDTYAGTVYATYAGSQQGVTIRTPGLVQTSLFGTGVDASDLAVTPGGSIYITAANSIYHYDLAGTLINQMIFPISSINYTGIDFGYGLLFASYNGSQLGYTVRDLGLNQLRAYNLGFDITGIAVGRSANLYLTSANNIYEYDFFGNQLNVMTFPDSQILYSSIDVAAVPEPASWAMLIAGFGLVGAVARRRREAIAA